MNCLNRIARLIQWRVVNSNFSRSTTLKLSNVSSTLVQPPHISNVWIWQKNHKVEIPLIYNNKIELPNLKYILPLIDEPSSKEIIEAPAMESNDISKHAARLIVIRRKKMKKHKLKKLRKRMRFEWAKLRQKRELKKEKAFQAILIQQCKDAEAFSAEKYVQERIDKLNEVIVPRYWKGRRLPEFIIREKMSLPPKK